TLRDQLAKELAVEPRRLARLTPVVTAHSLLHVRERKRTAERRTSRLSDEDELRGRQDRRDVLGRVVREALATELRLEPSLLRGLTVDQAAAVLVRLAELRGRLQD